MNLITSLLISGAILSPQSLSCTGAILLPIGLLLAKAALLRFVLAKLGMSLSLLGPVARFAGVVMGQLARLGPVLAAAWRTALPESLSVRAEKPLRLGSSGTRSLRLTPAAAPLSAGMRSPFTRISVAPKALCPKPCSIPTTPRMMPSVTVACAVFEPPGVTRRTMSPCLMPRACASSLFTSTILVGLMERRRGEMIA